MSPFLPIAVGLPTAVGVGYFCADIYRNRRRLGRKPVPAVDMTGCDAGIVPDGGDLHAIGQHSGRDCLLAIRELVLVKVDFLLHRH